MLGFEVSPVVQYVVAFAIIAALLALFAFVLKRIGGNRFSLAGQDRGRTRQPRLGIVDVYDLDRQRQLVLLRRDNVEHLVMLGGPNDLVVESNIVRVPARAGHPAEFQSERTAQLEGPVEPAPSRPVFEPAPAAAALDPQLARPPGDPAFQPPREQRPPQRPQAPQPVQAPLQASEPPQPPAPAFASSVAEGPQAEGSPAISVTPPPFLKPAADSAARESASPPFARPPAPPAPASPAQEARQEPPAAVLAEAAQPVSPAPAPAAAEPEPKRGLFGFGRQQEKPAAPMPPFPPRSRATPVPPDLMAQRPQPKFAPAAGGDEQPVGEPSGSPFASAPSSSPAPSPAPRTPRPQDDLILSDMAKQLEAALKRPVAPAPARSASASSGAEEARDALASTPRRYEPAVTPPPLAAFSQEREDAPKEEPAPSYTPATPVPPRPYGAIEPEETPASADSAAEPEEAVAAEPVRFAPVVGEEERAAAAEETVIGEEPVDVVTELPPMELPSKEALRMDLRVEPAPDAESGRAGMEETAEPAAEAPPEEMTAPAYAEVEEHPAIVAGEPEPEPLAETGSADEEEHREADRWAGRETGGHAMNGHEEPSIASESPEPAAEAAPSGEPREEKRSPIDPFSVDEIEAEFARLLGRTVEKDPKSS